MERGIKREVEAERGGGEGKKEEGRGRGKGRGRGRGAEYSRVWSGAHGEKGKKGMGR